MDGLAQLRDTEQCDDVYRNKDTVIIDFTYLDFCQQVHLLTAVNGPVARLRQLLRKQMESSTPGARNSFVLLSIDLERAGNAPPFGWSSPIYLLAITHLDTELKPVQRLTVKKTLADPI